MTTHPSEQVRNLGDLMSPAAMELLSASGGKLVKQMGIEVIRDVVYSILTGRNLRDSTEFLTRRRIAALNLATTGVFVRGCAISPSFLENLPLLASEILQRKGTTKPERWIAQWVLGLTDKAF